MQKIVSVAVPADSARLAVFELSDAENPGLSHPTYNYGWDKLALVGNAPSQTKVT